MHVLLKVYIISHFVNLSLLFVIDLINELTVAEKLQTTKLLNIVAGEQDIEAQGATSDTFNTHKYKYV